MKFAFDSKSNRKVDSNGFLHVSSSNISKETVNPYYGFEVPNFEALGLDPNKIYKAYRKGSELEKGAHTFNNLPLMRNHHQDSAQNPQIEHRIGSIGSDCTFDSPYLCASLCVTDKEAIEKIENGERMELSCAYAYTPVLEAGVFNGEEYDFIMTNIRGNHVALVENGRAGSDVIVSDSALNPNHQNPQDFGINKDQNMEKVNVQNANDEDKNKKINELVTEFNLSPEQAKKLRDSLTDLAYSPATGDSEANTAKDTAETESADDKACDENPAFAEGVKYGEEHAEKNAKDEDEKAKLKDAFAEGVKYAENLYKKEGERQKLDSEHESKGMSGGASDSLPQGMALDANSIRREIMAEMNAKNQAVKAVLPLVGELDPMAYDSAQDIYKTTCDLLNVSASKQTAQDVCMALVSSHSAKSAYNQPLAQDSKYKSPFAG